MPVVSVLIAVHDDARFVGDAVESVLRQTFQDLELVVVDDASTDETPELLERFADKRLVVISNDEQRGLAASLNRGLERAAGQYVARLDADDVASPDRLELQVVRIQADPPIAIVGSAITDLDAVGALGRTHRLPQGGIALRWHALFSSPFFHPTVLVDRDVLDEHGLRYDPAYLESEDYDLWTRLFVHADGGNLLEPLVQKRVHAGQASRRRADIQQSFQRDVALREIARVAPQLTPEDAELAWRLGAGLAVAASSRRSAGEALQELLGAFERVHGVEAGVRDAVARALARGGLVSRALRVAPTLPLRVAGGRLRKGGRSRDTVVRVAVVSPEPTPYRSPLFDGIASRPDLDLTVIYAARTVAARTWSVEPHHRAVYLAGVRLPGLRRLLRHDYPVTPGIGRALRQARPHVVVVSGWSTFASQAAMGWARVRRLPYVLLVESHDLGPRPAWRRAVKGAVVTPALRGAASVLVVGTAARDSLVARGAAPERVRVFANTIEVQRWIERAQTLPIRRHDGIRVLSVGRLVPDKAFDVLVRAATDAGVELVIAGAGPEHERLLGLARELAVQLTILGDIGEDELAQQYVDADVFALLSRHEPWGVVVNEAAASGLPLVLSDRVGAAHDLLLEGENGFLVPADETGPAAAALRRLATDPDLRLRMGARSRELVRGWDYSGSIEGFAAAVREATVR